MIGWAKTTLQRCGLVNEIETVRWTLEERAERALQEECACGIEPEGSLTSSSLRRGWLRNLRDESHEQGCRQHPAQGGQAVGSRISKR